MAINKVIYQGQTLVDLTNDTITANDLAKGVTAHAANGELITGTMTGGEGGIDTSDATATKSEIFLNKTAYVNGEKVTGEFTIDNELTEQDEIILQIESALNDKIDAYDNGYVDGRQAEYDAFWKVLQNNGSGANYYYAFAYNRFTDANFTPKYNIVGSTVATSTQNVFYNATKLTEIPVSIVVNSTHAGGMFYKCSMLKTIHKLVVTEKVNAYNSTFSGCSALENITIEGAIAANIDFSASPLLTHDSLMSIIEHLSTVTATRTCTLGTTNLAKLTDAEKAIATEKGWTLA